MKARARVIVSGILRGTFIRSTVKTKAKALNVKGWIRSNTEGEIEAVLEGEKEDVDEVATFIKNGPNSAVVYSFDIRWEEFKNEFSDFEIIPESDFRVSVLSEGAKRNQSD